MSTQRLHTKIVATIGPSSREPDVLVSLLQAGVDVARMNFSHGEHALHAENIARLRTAAAAVGKPVAVLVDLQGPKLRVGDMGDGVELPAGSKVVLTTASFVGRPGLVPVQYADLPSVVARGERILLDDGLIELEVRSTTNDEIVCQVITGGLLTSKKGLNLPDASLSIPAITDKDRADLKFALAQGVDWVALSFVRTADEVRQLKALIQKYGTDDIPTLVVAKIEKPQAVQNIEEIAAEADGIMVARGDLGIEMPTEVVPMIQKRLIRHCNRLGKPVITATQMLDSMIRNPRPTRAEATDVANAVLDGTDAVMLSGETAAGRYPVLAVETMSRIVAEAEESLDWRLPEIHAQKSTSITVAMAHASVETARDLNARAIITPTVTGVTARMISRFRPLVPIVAVTPQDRTQHQLMLSWGVYPLHAPRADSSDKMIADAVAAAHTAGFVTAGDITVLTAGSRTGGSSHTDLMKVQVVTE